MEKCWSLCYRRARVGSMTDSVALPSALLGLLTWDRADRDIHIARPNDSNSLNRNCRNTPSAVSRAIAICTWSWLCVG